MKKVWKIVGIAALVAMLGVAVVGTAAYAQDADADWPFDFGQRFKEAVAEILGISVDEYEAAVDQAQGQVLGQAVTEGWLTEDQAAEMQERMEQGFELRGRGAKGLMGPRGMMGRGGHSLLDVAADELEMSVQDLLAELQDGKTIAGAAGAKGIEPQAIADAYLAQIEESLNQAVADGKLTQARADWQLAQAQENVTAMLEQSWDDFAPEGFHHRGFPGGMRGFPGGTEEVPVQPES
ncbi:MAG: hypothetical protein PVF47_14360 [Anaerolineae bacterium]|jgi:hypothetical protein